MRYDVDRNTVHHTPDRATLTKMETLRGHYQAVTFATLEAVPDGREKSLALTKLEESLMWAMAALARASYDAGEGGIPG